MKKITVTIILVIGLALGGCSGMSDTEQRTLSGAAIGAGAGTAIGAISGNTALGAVIGTAAGAGGGYLYDRHKKSEEKVNQKDNKDPSGNDLKAACFFFFIFHFLIKISSLNLELVLYLIQRFSHSWEKLYIFCKKKYELLTHFVIGIDDILLGDN